MAAVRGPSIFIAVLLLGLWLGSCGRSGSEQEKKAPAGLQVPATDRHEVPVPQTIQDQVLTPDDIKDGAKLIAETIPTGEGPLRLLISGDGDYSCSATGNCDRWIFRQTATGYELEADLGSAQQVNIEKKQGFPDVLARQHGSATSAGLRLYQYDGTRYRLTKCMDEDYLDASKPERTLDKPVVTETPCEADLPKQK